MEQSIDSRMRKWRSQKRLTLREVSDLTGISTALLSLAERGERDIAPMTKVQIARRLKVRLGVLFEPTDDGSSCS